MRVMIAGGAGFLGSHLCDYYLREHEVVCVDNFSTGSRTNISHLEDIPKFTFVEADIIEPLPDNLLNDKFDVILNLASPASPPHYQRLSIETLMAGAQGSLQLLDLAKANDARFFHASTSEVYGDPTVHPQPESYRGNVNCYGPRSMYDEAKRFSEALIYSYRQRFGTNTAIARFFNTYGPRMDPHDGRVVSNFIVQALEGKPLTVYGEGNQTRSFCYVEDLVRGIVALVESGEEGPMNLGNPDEFTILELAALVKQLTGSESEIVHEPLPGDDPMQRKPVIDLAQEKLGWEPKVKLQDGLPLTIAYFEPLLELNPQPHSALRQI